MALQKQITVTGTPVLIQADGDTRVLIQNLGAGVLYIGNDATVSSANGVKIAVDAAFETPADLFSTQGGIYVVSAGTSDVRILRVG